MATMTITTDNGQATRLATALGAKLGYGRAATADEVKQFTVRMLRGVVHSYEREQEQEQQPPSLAAWEPT